jgi:hypothetical protein
LGHNTLTFWGQLQNKDAYVPVQEFYSDPDWAYATLDLTGTYAGYVEQCTRKYWFQGREQVEIIDEIIPAMNPLEVRWAMVTPATIALHGNQAILSQNGKQVRVHILEPEGAVFEELSTRPEDPGPEEHLNEGTTMLAFTHRTDEAGAYRLHVVLDPVDTTLAVTEPSNTKSNREAGEKELRVFPNPAKDEAFVSFDLDTEARVRLSLFDLAGRHLVTLMDEVRSAGLNEIPLSLGSFPPGIYTLIVEGSSGRRATRISISR